MAVSLHTLLSTIVIMYMRPMDLLAHNIRGLNQLFDFDTFRRSRGVPVLTGESQIG